MNVLIVGGHGFVASHIAAMLLRHGHTPVLAVRRARTDSKLLEIPCDLNTLLTAAAWQPLLANVHAVINAAGLLRGTPLAHQHVHCDAPAALAAACAALKKPFLHISALGLDNAKSTPYFNSKRDGEVAIRMANSAAIIVRPSLLFGAESAATKLMLLQARLPFLVQPGNTKFVAPLHVDDLAKLCITLISTLRALGCDVDALGQSTLSMADYINALRHAMHRKPAPIMHLPNWVMRFALQGSAWLGARTLVPEALDLMEHAHVGDAHHYVRWMHHAPRPISAFLQTKPVMIAAQKLA
jgi:nucleoside-diphosphate-sugar epimerase